MRRTIELPRIDFEGKGKPRNRVDATLSLVDLPDGKYQFTATARVWSVFHTKILKAGTCFDILDQFNELRNDPIYKNISHFYHEHQSNDKRPGTAEQEEAVKEYFRESGETYSFEKAVQILQDRGLYIVDLPSGEKYRYGDSFIYHEIPKNDIDSIKLLIESNAQTVTNTGKPIKEAKKGKKAPVPVPSEDITAEQPADEAVEVFEDGVSEMSETVEGHELFEPIETDD